MQWYFINCTNWKLKMQNWNRENSLVFTLIKIKNIFYINCYDYVNVLKNIISSQWFIISRPSIRVSSFIGIESASPAILVILTVSVFPRVARWWTWNDCMVYWSIVAGLKDFLSCLRLRKWLLWLEYRQQGIFCTICSSYLAQEGYLSVSVILYIHV